MHVYIVHNVSYAAVQHTADTHTFHVIPILVPPSHDRGICFSCPYVIPVGEHSSGVSPDAAATSTYITSPGICYTTLTIRTSIRYVHRPALFVVGSRVSRSMSHGPTDRQDAVTTTTTTTTSGAVSPAPAATHLHHSAVGAHHRDRHLDVLPGRLAALLELASLQSQVQVVSGAMTSQVRALCEVR